MTEIIRKELEFPLDENGFLRRECPYCIRQFKIQKDDFESLDDEEEYYCPYCGQVADEGNWCTQDQLDFITKISDNIITDLFNENFIRPMSRKFSNSKSLKFEGKELQKSPEIIQPESNDMKLFQLKCCEKEIKILDDWKDGVYCYFCGFHHKMNYD